MRLLKKLVFALMLLMLLVSGIAYLVFVRTHASNVHSLIIIANLEKSDYTLLPVSFNWVPFSPDVALWLLRNTDWPHKKECRATYYMPFSDMCDDRTPLSWASGVLGNPRTDARAFQVLSVFVEKREDLDKLSFFELRGFRVGMAPIHEAVLDRDDRFARMLLENGANPRVTIDGPGSKYHGLTPLQFLDLLSTNPRFDYSQVREVLREFGA